MQKVAKMKILELLPLRCTLERQMYIILCLEYVERMNKFHV